MSTPDLRRSGPDPSEHDPDGLGDDAGAGAGAGPSRRVRLLLGAALVVALALVATWVIAFSSLFGARSVVVHGTHTLTAAQVENAADVVHGTPLVRLDTAAVTTRVERLPDVSSAQVSTSFPSTVVITVVERTAVGYLSVGGHAELVDRTGDAYHSVASAPAGLPRLEVPTGAAARSARAAVARVATSLPQALRPQIRSIDALDPAAITLVLTEGRVARWGSAGRSAEKGRILPVLLQHAKGDTQFDVTDPDQPFSR